MTKSTKKFSVYDIVYIAMFAAIMAVTAWVSVPAPIPFTMQTFGVFAAVGVLGGKRGSLAVSVYLLIGMLGVPVFSGFSGGVGVLFSVTGGYIIGFLFSALVMWGLEILLPKKGWALPLSMAVGLLICYAFGTAWFMILYAKSGGYIGLGTALSMCVLPYVIPDALKLLLATLLSKRIGKLQRSH